MEFIIPLVAAAIIVAFVLGFIVGICASLEYIKCEKIEDTKDDNKEQTEI